MAGQAAIRPLTGPSSDGARLEEPDPTVGRGQADNVQDGNHRPWVRPVATCQACLAEGPDLRDRGEHAAEKAGAASKAVSAPARRTGWFGIPLRHRRPMLPGLPA